MDSRTWALLNEGAYLVNYGANLWMCCWRLEMNTALCAKVPGGDGFRQPQPCVGRAHTSLDKLPNCSIYLIIREATCWSELTRKVRSKGGVFFSSFQPRMLMSICRFWVGSQTHVLGHCGILLWHLQSCFAVPYKVLLLCYASKHLKGNLKSNFV